MIKQNTSIDKTILLFIGIIFFYIAYQCIQMPYFLLSGEMWAEMATNYFYHSQSNSLTELLFSTDAGYIPLPQRLIALLGKLLGISGENIPYYYSWTGTIITAMLVGVFTLKEYRTILRNDWLRFLICTFFLICIDWETKTFINFTYVGLFFITITSCLIIISRGRIIPKYTILFPIFILSKPAVLISIPFVLISIFFTIDKKTKIILVVSILIGLLQVLRLHISATSQATSFNEPDLYSVVYEQIRAIKEALWFIGGYTSGPFVKTNHVIGSILGLLIVLLTSYLLYRKRYQKVGVILLLGISIIFFSELLNVIALHNVFFPTKDDFNGRHIDRKVVGVLTGFFFILIACLRLLSEKLKNTKKLIILAFLGYFLCTGWLGKGIKTSRQPEFPTIYTSNWHELYSKVKNNENFCIPIAPNGWNYSHKCKYIINEARNYIFNHHNHKLFIQNNLNQQHQKIEGKLLGITIATYCPEKENFDLSITICLKTKKCHTYNRHIVNKNIKDIIPIYFDNPDLVEKIDYIDFNASRDVLIGLTPEEQVNIGLFIKEE